MKNNKARSMAPLIEVSKSEMVKEGVRLGAPLELTWSCYEGRECAGPALVQAPAEGFREVGIRDPVNYKSTPENGYDLHSKTV